MVIFSTLHGYFILKVPPSFRDFNEIIRIIKPFLIIILVDYCNENVLTKYLDILLYYILSKKNKLAKLIVLPSALKGTEGCRRHRRTMKAMKGNKGNEAY